MSVMAAPGMRATDEKASITEFRAEMVRLEVLRPQLDRESEVKDYSLHRKHAASTQKSSKDLGKCFVLLSW